MAPPPLCCPKCTLWGSTTTPSSIPPKITSYVSWGIATKRLLSFDGVARPVYSRHPQCFWYSSPTTSGEQSDIVKFYFAVMFCVGVTVTSLVALCFHNWCCFSCPTSETGPENCIRPKEKLFATLALALLGLLDLCYLQMIFHRWKIHKPIQWLHCALLLLSPSLS